MISTKLKQIVDPNNECCCEYHLAHKCKKWAFDKGYSNLSGKDNIYEKEEHFVCSIGCSTLLIKDFYADTEPEAIFKACQWILEERIKNE